MDRPAYSPKAYSYLRFSTPEQALGDSKRRQVEAARAWAAAHGLTLDEELTDEGVSGFRGANTRSESGLGSFLGAINAGLVPRGSYLIVESLDRLTRDRVVHAQMLFLQILAAGVTIVTLMDGKTYSVESVNANPVDMITSLLVMMRANEESETKSRRLRAAWAQKRREAREGGKRLTTVTPAWLRSTADGGFELIAERAAVVRRIFAETLAGDGQHRIAERLTVEGVPTWKGGKVWHRTYIRKVLENPAVIGRAVLHETERLDGGGTRRKAIEVLDGYYPPAIELETWTRTQALLGNRQSGGIARRGRHAGSAVRHLLANLARCAVCAGAMTRVSKGPGGGRAYLVCTRAKAGGNCVYKGVPVDLVDGALFSGFGPLLADVPPSGKQEVALQQQLEQLELSADAIGDELSDLQELRRARRNSAASTKRELELYDELGRLDEERTRLRALLADAAAPLVRARVDRLWDALEAGPQADLTAANAAMRDAFAAVIVDHFAGCLRLQWRHGGESILHFAWTFEDVSHLPGAYQGDRHEVRRRVGGRRKTDAATGKPQQDEGEKETHRGPLRCAG